VTTTGRNGGVDLVTLEILWNRLIAVTNEQAAALMRTSFTPIVRDIGDLSAAVFDTGGQMLAQATTGTPGHINSLASGMRHILGRFPQASFEPGDVLITNDPWMTSGQLNDISIVTPVFHRGRLVGFFGNTCHAIDIGGIGLSADGHEVYEEGLQIPIAKLYTASGPNQTLFEVISANVRAPREVLGDLHAQVAGNQVGAERLVAYLDEFGIDDLSGIGEQILGRSEVAMRTAIATLPDGEYTKTCITDGDLEPITIKVTLRVSGDSLVADFAGSSPQSDRGLNVVLNYTAAYTNYALKCALAPGVPNNEGSFRPVTVVAPEGSIFNPLRPAAVAARQIAGHFIPHTIFGALEPILPDRLIAEGAGGIWLTNVRGNGASKFVAVLFAAGGTGARPGGDGLATTSFPSAVATAPVEVIETESPLVIRCKEFRTDSGGVGRYRGGPGQTIRIEVRSGEPYSLSVLGDRTVTAAAGYAGGGPGALARITTDPPVAGDPKFGLRLPAGTAFTLELPGGGGYHDPAERDPELVARDVADGIVSNAAAERDYGWTGRSPAPGSE
jgi:N-methylhydantoinase B